MANEITLVCNTLLKNSMLTANQSQSKQVDQTTQGKFEQTYTVPISETAVEIPAGITTPGRVQLLNLDESATPNNVTWGPDSGGTMAKIGELRPGEPTSFRLTTGVTIRWVAAPAPARVQVLILED